MNTNVTKYQKVEVRDRALFIDCTTIPNGAEFDKKYEGEMCVVTFHNIEENLLNSFKNRLVASKAMYYGARTATSVGKVGAKFAKSLFKGGQKFLEEMNKEMKDPRPEKYGRDMKKLTEEEENREER